MTQWLVTTSRSLLLVEGETGSARVIHEGWGLYYGLCFAGEGGALLHAAARRRMVSSPEPAEEERGLIVTFGRDLRATATYEAPFPMRDLHQILIRGDTLWATCSFDNMIAVREGGRWEAWYPLGEPAGLPRDTNHFNTLLWHEGRLAIVAHNLRNPPSEVLAFEWPSRRLVERFPLGAQAHNLWRDGGEWVICSSGEGRILDTAGRTIGTGGYPRGIGFTPGEICIGISEPAERMQRDLSLGRLQFRAPDWSLRRTLLLEGEGLVLEVVPLPAGFAPPAEAPVRKFRFEG